MPSSLDGQEQAEFNYLCFDVERVDFKNIPERAFATNFSSNKFDLAMRCVHLLNPINLSEFVKSYNNIQWCGSSNFDNTRL